jgi:hypothetical protein
VEIEEGLDQAGILYFHFDCQVVFVDCRDVAQGPAFVDGLE